MRKYTIEELKSEFSRLGYKWENFHLIGIRSKANLPNVFDDFLILINGDKITYAPATTNPGTHWLKNLLNTKGTALLKPAQYVDTWQIGMHQGKYEAFVQAKAVTVYRDGDKDDLAEETSITETGFFGINLHRTNDSGIISKLIDKWSAGCQVFSNPADFKEFLHQAKLSNKKLFTYTLLREF